MEELCGAIMKLKVQDEVESPLESESPDVSPGTQNSDTLIN